MIALCGNLQVTVPSCVFFLKLSVCVRGEEVGTEGCVHLLSLILCSLAAVCYANGNTKHNRGSGFGFMYKSKTVDLQTLVNINGVMIVSLFLGIHNRYNFCPNLV